MLLPLLIVHTDDSSLNRNNLPGGDQILALKFTRVGLYCLARFTFPKGTLAHIKLLWAFFISISRFKYTGSN